MSWFTGQLVVEEVGVDTDVWILRSPLSYDVGEKGSGRTITVPNGFMTDGASIPPPINLTFPRWGRKYRRPAIIHDYLYRLISEGTPHIHGRTKTAADAIFLEAMGVCGVSLPVRLSFYSAVAAFGDPTRSGDGYKRLIEQADTYAEIERMRARERERHRD